MSLSHRSPSGSPPDGDAASSQDREGSRSPGVTRATQADAVWILAATVIFVGFQVFALLMTGP